MEQGTSKHRTMRALGWAQILLGMSISISCGPGVSASPACKPSAAVSRIGYSGMAPYGDDAYLVVHDTKRYKGPERAKTEGPRLGLLELDDDGVPCYRVLEVDDWRHPEGRSSDLESACALPQAGELLVAESGPYRGRFGRVFHLRLSGTSDRVEVEVVAVYSLPEVADPEFEGLACVEVEKDEGDDELLVILGERGDGFAPGILYLGTLRPAEKSLSWSDGEPLEVVAPGPWPDEHSRRDLSALHATSDGVLWGAATSEASDAGPFRSLIYEVARIHPEEANPVVLSRPVAAWTLDGIRVEALSGPAGCPGVLSFATEDEDLGGIWRPLYPSVASPPAACSSRTSR